MLENLEAGIQNNKVLPIKMQLLRDKKIQQKQNKNRNRNSNQEKVENREEVEEEIRGESSVFLLGFITFIATFIYFIYQNITIH